MDVRLFHSVVLILAAALAAVPDAGAASADPQMVRLLPPGATAAGNVDLAGLRASSVFQTYKAMAGLQGGAAPEAGETPGQADLSKRALDLVEGLESIVVATYLNDAEAPSEREDLFVLRGAVGDGRIERFLEGAPVERAEHRGVAIQLAPRHMGEAPEGFEPNEPEPPVSIAVLADDLAVAGTEARVRQAIDRHLDRAAVAEAANEALLAKGGSLAEGYQLWHVVNAAPLQAMASAGLGPEAGPPGLGAGMMSGLLNGMDQLRIALKLSDGVGLRLDGLFESPERAKLASQAFAGLLAFSQLGGGPMGESPVPEAAGQLLRSVKLVSEDSAAGFELNITGEQIAGLALSIMAGAEGMQPAQ